MSKITVAIVLLLTVASGSPGYASQRLGLRGVAEFNDQCGSPDRQFFPAAVLAVIAEPLIKAGINSLGAALQKAGSPDEASVSSHTSVMFYRVSSTVNDPAMDLVIQHSCLMIAVGVGVGDGSDTTASAASLTQDGTTFLTDKGGFSRLPSFFLAGAIDVSKDRTAWRFVPQTMFVGSSLTSAGPLSKSGRDLVLTITLKGAAAKADDAALSVHSIGIDRSVISRISGVISPPDQESLATGWMPLPSVSDGTKDRLAAAAQRKMDRKKLEQAQASYFKEASDTSKAPASRAAAKAKVAEAVGQISTLDNTISSEAQALTLVLPVSFEFNLHEARDGNKFLADLGKTLSDNSAALAKPIAERIDPKTREDAKVTAGEAGDKLHIDAINAVGAWQESVAKKEDAYKQAAAKQSAIGACRTLVLRGFAEPICLELD